MSLTLIPNLTTVRQRYQTTFVAAGGIAPYSFAMVNGSGTVDPVTGIYTAGSSTEIDTVQVTDSTPVTPLTATANVTVASPLTLLCDILSNQLGLAGDQVFLYQEKFTPPTDLRMYIAVGVLSSKCFGSGKQFVPDNVNDLLNEVVSANFRMMVSVDIYGRGRDAMDRRDEVILALQSTYSQQRQELYGFQIAAIPSSFVNLSSVDGAAIPHRFSFSLSLTYSVSTTRSVPFFENFTMPPTVLTNA